MPKIETLNQSSRMNVGSPTSIRSSEGARMTGENIAQFGNDIGRAAMTMGQIYRQAKADENKLDLVNISEAAESISHEAEARALQNYNPDADKDGLGLFKSYQESYQKEASKLIENISDPVLRSQASATIKSFENSKAKPLYDANAKLKAQHLENKSLQAYNTMGANVYANPETVLTKIADSDNLIASSEFTHSPMVKEQLMIERRKGLAMSALTGYIANGQFDRADMALKNELAPFLGGDAENLGKGIREAKMRNKAQAQQDAHQSEQNFEKSRKEEADTLAGELTVKLTNTRNPAERAEIIAETQRLVTRGILPRPVGNSVVNTKYVYAAGSARTASANKYYRQLSAETLSPTFNEEVTRDMQFGIVPTDIGNQLIASANAKRQWEKTVKDPVAQAELRQASAMVAKLTQPANPNFVGQQLSMQAQINAEVAQGQRPVAVAERVIMKHHKSIVDGVELPGIPKGVQGTYKTLKASEPMIRKQYQKLKADGLLDEANALRRNFEARLESLQVVEGYNERTR